MLKEFLLRLSVETVHTGKPVQHDKNCIDAKLPPCQARNSLAALLIALGAAYAGYAVLPGATLVQSLVQTAVLAAVILGIIAWSAPEVLKCAGLGPLRAPALWTAGVGLVGGVLLLALHGPVPEFDPVVLLPRIALVLVLCLATGVFEEGLFRVLLMHALVQYGPFAKHPWLGAALVSSTIFALLHVPLAALSNIVTLASLQAMLKLAQTAVFGMIMAGLYAAHRSLWQNSFIHAAFNFCYLGPVYLGLATPTTYLPGAFDDFAVLILTLILLIPPAVTLWRKLVRH